MAWNKALPTDAEKIRNLGIVIRPNWEAIEEGDDVGVGSMLQMRSVQLDNRTGLAANNDPITNAGTHYVYSKDDGGGVQEGFMKDSAGNVIQMTNDGGIGSASTTIHFNDLTNDDGTTTYDEKNLVAYWATVTAGGSISAQSGGLSVSKTGNSTYRVTFSTAQLNANYAVNVTANHNPGNPRICTYYTPTTANFNVKIVNQNGTQISAGAAFSVTVYGGRPT